MDFFQIEVRGSIEEKKVEMKRSSGNLFEDKILQPPHSRLRQFGIHQKMAVDDFRIQHAPARLHHRQMPTVGQRHAQTQFHDGVHGHRSVNAFQ